MLSKTFSSMPGAGSFFGLGAGIEAVAHVVMLPGAEPLEGAGTDVVVGQDEAIFGNKLGGSTRAHRSLLEVLQPGVGKLKAIFLAEQFAGRVVVKPHASIGPGKYGEE